MDYATMTDEQRQQTLSRALAGNEQQHLFTAVVAGKFAKLADAETDAGKKLQLRQQADQAEAALADLEAGHAALLDSLEQVGGYLAPTAPDGPPGPPRGPQGAGRGKRR